MYDQGAGRRNGRCSEGTASRSARRTLTTVRSSQPEHATVTVPIVGGCSAVLNSALRPSASRGPSVIATASAGCRRWAPG